MEYESTVKVRSKVAEDVAYRIVRMSFGRRIELTRRVRELAAKLGFLEAGDTPEERLEAAAVANEIERLYLEWGLQGIEGLTIDGKPATPELLIACGPEELCREIVEAIKAECGLSEEERKN